VFQRVYTEEVLDRVMMHEANPVATPCDRSSGESEDSVGSHVLYREAVGYLMCLMKEHVQTAFAVSQAARAMDRPTEAHWTDVKHTLKYLRGTSNYGLLYGAGNSKGVLEAFSDAGFADDVRARRSTSGVVAVYAGSAIAWSSQLQRSVTLSTEAEFIAARGGQRAVLAKRSAWRTRWKR
jgi:hypothetical protein